MGRYLKYLEVVNKIDTALEKMVAGKVDISKDLPKLKLLLEVQEKALCMSRQIDRIDDNVKSTAKLYSMGDESAQEVVESLMRQVKQEKGEGHEGESSKGKDFRGGHQDTEAYARPWGSHSTRSWPEEGRSYADEEDRRGVKGTGRYSRSRSRMDDWDEEEDRRGRYRHSRSDMDGWEDEEDRHRSPRTGRYVRGEMPETDWYPFMPFMTPFGRMGYTGNMGESNAPYNTLNGVQIPVQNNVPASPAPRGPIQGAPANPKPAPANA